MLLRFCVLVTLIVLASCGDLVSIHPLATPSNAAFDASLAGKWQCAAKDCEGAVYILATPGGMGTYDITWVPGEADEPPMRLRGQLVKLGQTRIFDLVAVQKLELAVPVHIYFRVETGENTLTASWLDSEWIQKEASAAGSVAHTIIDQRPVMTAPSAELAKFFLPRAGDRRAVSDALAFRRAQ